jgi:hypothetical protein
LLQNTEPRESYRNEFSNFFEYLAFFANELKKGKSQEIALAKAFEIYYNSSRIKKDNCVMENFRLKPKPCSFKERWRKYMAQKYPNLLIMYLIDTIIEMLNFNSKEAGRRLDEFLPLLKGSLEENDAWNLVCQKSALEFLKEAFEIPVVISNLTIGEAWMLVFLLSHFNIHSDEIRNWKFDCSVLDSTIPVLIRDYAQRLLFLKYVTPSLHVKKGPSEIDWSEPIPIQFPCPECRPYINLPTQDWGYIQLHTPDALIDYHKCPICKKLWAIRRFHIDESLWNLK